MENEAAISGLHVRVDHVMLKGIVTAVPASEDHRLPIERLRLPRHTGG